MDGFSWATMFSPKLTCVAQPSYEIGRRAADSLIEKDERSLTDKITERRGHHQAKRGVAHQRIHRAPSEALIDGPE
jgi:DNA-binding LacI/PurR family transcriptional regulator